MGQFGVLPGDALSSFGTSAAEGLASALSSYSMSSAGASAATIALNELAGTMAAEFNVQMAGSLILALPVLVLYIFMGKYLISGQMSGAVTAS